MADPRVDVIRRLARRGASAPLHRALVKSRPEDIAEAISHLAPAEQRQVIAGVEEDEAAAMVLSNLGESDLQNLVRSIELSRLVRMLEAMEVDDEADIIERLPEDLRAQVLEALEADEQQLVEDILAWPDDSAGGIMQPLAFRLHEDATCREAITALHEQQEDLEMVFYLYVENDTDQLVGVASLRALLIHPPSTQVRDIMTTDVITVAPEVDQEEVARLVSRYDLLALPVVDESRRLLGIVTIDDVVDVIKEEAIEDMMLMAGVGEDLDAHDASPLRSAALRFKWLIFPLLGGMLISEIIGLFETALQREVALIGFIPVMLGSAGNVGVQAATISVRNLALGRINPGAVLKELWRETRVGLIMGLAYALALGGYALLRWWDQPLVGGAIASAIIVTVTFAAALGTMVPFTLARVGVDPAVATGPFVTTTLDATSILIYFGTASLILGL